MNKNGDKKREKYEKYEDTKTMKAIIPENVPETTYVRPVSHIKKINFELMSSDEIKKYSGILINESKQTGEGSIYDNRMGMDSDFDEHGNKAKCMTCDGSHQECDGHFGYIELSVPILNPNYINQIMEYLSLRCIYCFGCLLEFKILKLLSALNSTRKKLIGLALKIKECPSCNEPVPKMYIDDDHIYYYYDTKELKYEKSEKGRGKQTKVEITGEYILKLCGSKEKINGDLCLSQTIFKHFKIEKYILLNLPVLPPCGRPSAISGKNERGLDDFSYKYIDIIKYNNNLKNGKLNEKSRQECIRQLEFHIKTLFNNKKGKAKQYHGTRPIKCIKSRWTGKQGRFRGNLMGKRTDFSARTVFNIDANLKVGEVGVPEEFFEKFTYPEFVNIGNLDQMTKLVNSGEALQIIRKINNMERSINIKTLRESTKTPGNNSVIIRPKLNYGDTVFRVKEIQNIPENYKLILNYKLNGKIKKESIKNLRVHGSMIKYTAKIDPELYELIHKKKLELKPDDIIKPLTGKTKRIKSIPSLKNIELKVGDIVERKIKDGDMLYFNRQPSLHKPSIMAGKARKINSKSIRLNTANCGPLNADCDGDELNLHVPQTEMSRIEAMLLSSVGQNLTNGKDSGVTISICQDTVTGGYRATKKIHYIEKSDFYQIINQIDWDMKYIVDKMKHIKNVYKKNGKSGKMLYSGHGLFSMLLPSDLEITYKRDNDGNAIITEGVLISGYIDKSLVGKKQNSLIQILTIYYSSQMAEEFATNYQVIIDHWNLLIGFSVGIRDCFSKDKLSIGDLDNYEGQAIIQAEKERNKCFIEARMIIDNEKNPRLREVKINNILNKANSIGEKIAKESLDPENAFIDMIKPGAKGNWVNIAQIITGLGQQNVNGERIPRGFKGRTLPHCHRTNSDITHIDMDEIIALNHLFEDRGFVCNSLLKGLNPKEFFFHAMGGRVGIIDTAVKTAVTGYISRRLVKRMEDLRINYFKTISNAKNTIYSFDYNEGFDLSKAINVSGSAQFCNVKILVDRLNKQFEKE